MQNYLPISFNPCCLDKICVSIFFIRHVFNIIKSPSTKNKLKIWFLGPYFYYFYLEFFIFKKFIPCEKFKILWKTFYDVLNVYTKTHSKLYVEVWGGGVVWGVGVSGIWLGHHLRLVVLDSRPQNLSGFSQLWWN